MYNALFSGLFNETVALAIDCRVDDGMKLLIDMKQSNVRPSSVTLSIFVDALGRCSTPRIVEAQLLVDEFIRAGCVSACDNRVLTSLIRLYGRVGNFQFVTSTFEKVTRPDTVAVNAYIDACCRCGREKMALDTFELYFRNTKKGLHCPDVVTYAILIGSILKRSSVESLQQARLLYVDMKTNYNISPDHGLIDVVLKSMIRIGTARELTKQHVMLIAEVLQDAELLFWDDGQLNRRRRAIRAIIFESFGNALRPNDPVFDLIPTSYSDDDLFDRKGWNQVHSGFRMWGPTVAMREAKPRNHGDEFLKSHGWNDVDSTFRLI
jgi:PPR repeat